MMSARSDVAAELATHDRKLAFHREVLRRVDLGQGGRSLAEGNVSPREFEDLIRGGAELAAESDDDRARTERQRFEVDDGWTIPEGGPGRPERGIDQLGSLGGGNHFIELQRAEETGKLYVQVHTGSRGFGHGLATNYFARAKDEGPELAADIDLAYFTPDSPLHAEYRSAVAAGANFAIVNRLLIFRSIREAFRKVFKAELELVYEISHNLVQPETHPEFGEVWVHRKGATRALPAGHPLLAGSAWESTGHPVLIPGSNRDYSYILRPAEGAVKSAFSVNHGAGRRLSRGQATRELDQQKIDEQYARDHILVNLDGRVPLDEAGPCYKSSREVIEAVESAGLATVETTLFPLGSLKADDSGVRARKAERREKERGRDLDRRAARRAKA
jgi:tRNA-splicing ligase RtcB